MVRGDGEDVGEPAEEKGAADSDLSERSCVAPTDVTKGQEAEVDVRYMISKKVIAKRKRDWQQKRRCCKRRK